MTCSQAVKKGSSNAQNSNHTFSFWFHSWRSAAQQGTAPAGLPSVTLPPELDRVLRDYETAWTAKDAARLAKLFAEDGYVLPADLRQ
jgi:hypothetical protein